MERYRTMRAYSAGGVVFRLSPMCSPDNNVVAQSADMQIDAADCEDMVVMEVALVGRSHAGIWALPKGTPQSGETIEQVAVREAQEETGLQVRLIAYIGSISYSFVRDQIRYNKQVRHFFFVCTFPVHAANCSGVCRICSHNENCRIPPDRFFLRSCYFWCTGLARCDYE